MGSGIQPQVLTQVICLELANDVMDWLELNIKNIQLRALLSRNVLKARTQWEVEVQDQGPSEERPKYLGRLWLGKEP
jgi:hypothetical protein